MTRRTLLRDLSRSDPDSATSLEARPDGSDPGPGKLLYSNVPIMKVTEWFQDHPDKAAKMDATVKVKNPAWTPADSVMARLTSRHLKTMSTEEILKAFALLGTPLDEATFKERAGGHTSAIDLLREDLHPSDEYPGRDDADFAWLGAVELWRRWVPRPCVEMLEEELSDGYLARDDHDREGSIYHWERAWVMLGKAIPTRIRSLEGAETHLTRNPPGPLGDWCADYCGALIDEMREGSRPAAERLLAFSKEVLERFPESRDGTVLLMRTSVAEAHAALGDRGRADEAYGAILKDDPDDVPTYLLWGDSLWRPPAVRREDVRTRDLARAEELYMKGLRVGGPLDDVLRDRLREINRWGERGYS
jgi:hypothetical protein